MWRIYLNLDPQASPFSRVLWHTRGYQGPTRFPYSSLLNQVRDIYVAGSLNTSTRAKHERFVEAVMLRIGRSFTEWTSTRHSLHISCSPPWPTQNPYQIIDTSPKYYKWLRDKFPNLKTIMSNISQKVMVVHCFTSPSIFYAHIETAIVINLDLHSMPTASDQRDLFYVMLAWPYSSSRL
jgi:hypothetical protein